MTTDGKNFMAYVLGHDTTLDIMDASEATPPTAKNYASVTCYWGDYPSSMVNDTPAQKERVCVLTGSNGKLTNKYDFVFQEADDPDYDYQTQTPSPGGWGSMVIAKMKLTRSGTVVYKNNLTDANGDPLTFTVPQDSQVRFKAGAISIEFNVTEVTPT